jgi:holdfast attachment protein HfaA
MKKSLLLVSLLAIQGYAMAQTFEGNMNSFETPRGMNSVTDIDSPVATRRDSNFNRTVVNSPNAGFAATSIGNLISVENKGSNNTVVINATQVNKGSQRASLGGSSDSGSGY